MNEMNYISYSIVHFIHSLHLCYLQEKNYEAVLNLFNKFFKHDLTECNLQHGFR